MILVSNPDALFSKRVALGLPTSPITCRFDEDAGSLVLVNWPDLRMPTQAEVLAWETEFPPARRDLKAEELFEILKKKNVVDDTDRPTRARRGPGK